MKVITNITLRVKGKTGVEYISPGAEVELTPQDAEVLLSRGQVRPLEQVQAAAPAPEVPPPSIDDIIEAILQLDPAKDYTNAGVPNVQAIELVLGTNINAKQRDEAWAKIQAETQEGTEQP